MLTQIAPSLFDTSATFRSVGTPRASGPRMVDDGDELDVSYERLAAAAGVTTRCLRNLVRRGQLQPPTVIRIKGSNLTIKRWPRSILDTVDMLPIRRR